MSAPSTARQGRLAPLCADDPAVRLAALEAAGQHYRAFLHRCRQYDLLSPPAAALARGILEGGGGGGGGGAHRAEAELLGSVPLPSLAALEIGADEAVQAAGTVQSMLEGMVVIKVGGPAWEVGRGPRSGAGSLGAAAGTAGVAAHTGGRGTAPYPSSIAARASLHRSFAGLGPARPRHVRRCCLQARPHRVCVTPCPLPAGAGRQPRPERGLRAGAGGSHTHRLRGGDLWPG